MNDVSANIGIPIKKAELTILMLDGLPTCSDMILTNLSPV